MGDDAANVTLVTMSEFGRTARENGTGGTDHGHANAMFVLGGRVKGGKVYGRWPGLFPIDSREMTSSPPSASTITSADFAISRASCISFLSVSSLGA